jgi:hypothetical protein
MAFVAVLLCMLIGSVVAFRIAAVRLRAHDSLVEGTIVAGVPRIDMDSRHRMRPA